MIHGGKATLAGEFNFILIEPIPDKREEFERKMCEKVIFY